MAQLSLEERLDEQPLGWGHWRVTLLAGLGWMFDAMDILLLSFVLAALARDWGLSGTELGTIASVGFFGMFLGAGIAGALADRWGRKALLIGTLLVYSLATGLSAFSTGLWMLLALRFITGLGLGGELPVASTLVSEIAPVRHRGRLIVLLESFWAYGSILAALIAFLMIPTYGWRVAFLLGGLPALFALVLRRGLPESPRYLLRAGREAEAREAAAYFGVPPDLPLAPSAARAERAGFGALFAPGYARRTLMLWVLWFGMVFSYYGVFTWLPQLLQGAGYSLTASFGYVLLITLAQVPGYFSAAWLVEAWGRKPTLVLYLVGSAAAAALFGLRGLGAGATETELLLWGSLLSFFNLGAWGVVYGYTPELYPTAIRGTGSGWAAGVGRIGGIIGPYAVPLLVGATGGALPVFALFAAVFLVIAADVWFLGEETRGQSLAEIAEGAGAPA